MQQHAVWLTAACSCGERLYTANLTGGAVELGQALALALMHSRWTVPDHQGFQCCLPLVLRTLPQGVPSWFEGCGSCCMAACNEAVHLHRATLDALGLIIICNDAQ